MPFPAETPGRACPKPLLCLVGALLALMLTPSPAAADFGFQLKWGQANSAACTGGSLPGPAAGEFDFPSGVTFYNGTVFVADQANNRIQKFNADGVPQGMWGRNGGQCGESGTGNGEFATPFGIATDGIGNVYVADADNNRIQKFNANGGFLTKWGANGGSGASGTGTGQFSTPFGIGVDQVNSFVYVADTGNGRIQKFSLSGAYLGQFSTSLAGDNDTPQPAGVAVDQAGDLYVSDVRFHRVAKYSGSNNSLISKWGTLGSAEGEFNSPFGVTIDNDDNVYVADFGNDRIQEFDSNGTFQTAFGSKGIGDGEFDRPTGIGTDPQSNVYVADRLNQRIQRFGVASSTGTSQIDLGTTLSFRAGVGAANDVTVSLSGGNYTITDANAAIAPGNQCAALTENSVSCPATGVNLVKVELLDRNDRALVEAPTNSIVDGGAENDTIGGGAGNDELIGGGGSDAVDYSGATGSVSVDLSDLAPQSTGAGTDTLESAESVYGSPQADTLTGSSSANTIRGSGGNDTLDGQGGTDTLDYRDAPAGVAVNLATILAQDTSGAGTDTVSDFENLTGSGHNDTLSGDSAGNVITGSAGDDTIDGSGGQDTASYASAATGVTVDLAVSGAQNTGGAGSDSLSAIEDVTGSTSADTLTGDDGANQLSGGLGNDLLEGRNGDDAISGGNGNDRLSYGSASSGVTANLSTIGAQVTGGAGSDTLDGFENITGSASDDSLTADAAANDLQGTDGNDTLIGAQGNDTVAGGNGTDISSYAGISSPVDVDLAITGAQNTGAGGTDTLTNVEGATGGNGNDLLAGDSGQNPLNGGSGNDTLDGRDGADSLVGGGGSDTADYSAAPSAVVVDLAGGTASGGLGSDTLSGIANITGSAANDTLTGNDNANTLNGGGGDDTLTGGGGANTLDGGNGNDNLSGGPSADALNGGGGSRDRVDYSAAGSAVSVNIAASAAQNTGGAGADTISNVEDLTGSAFNDTLTGNDAVNQIDAGAGNDDVRVRDYTADTANCGDGADQATADPSDALSLCETASVAVPSEPGGGGGPGAAPDGVPPAISTLRATRISVKRGGSFNYGLSETASVTFTLEKVRLGRKIRKKCKKQTRKNRRRKVCKYYVRAATLNVANDGGANSYPFNGKVNGKSLKFGLYRVIAVAIDGAGNKSKPTSATFAITR